MIESKQIELSISEAWDRVLLGQWIRHPSGYYARNVISDNGIATGQYLAFGSFPNSIRGAIAFTEKSL